MDRLEEWFALKVAVTRENASDAGQKYSGRLGGDAGLTVPVAVRGMTANAAYELQEESSIGTLETGKLADHIVVERNIFAIAPRQIAESKVLLTMVGGKAVYRDASFDAR